MTHGLGTGGYSGRPPEAGGVLKVNSGKGDGVFRADSLRAFCEEVFLSCGMAREDASIVADSLVQANLRGVDSHGVARVGSVSSTPAIGEARAASTRRGLSVSSC